MSTAVPLARVRIASEHGSITGPEVVALAATEATLPYAYALALVEKESYGGKNVWGGDDGGTFEGCPLPVTKGAFEVFEWYVVEQGHKSNGVGPCQITYAGLVKDGKRDGGYFRQMQDQGLRPWVPLDNMIFGFGLLKANKVKYGTWEKAGAHYNGGTKPDAFALRYGEDLVRRATVWQERWP